MNTQLSRTARTKIQIRTNCQLDCHSLAVVLIQTIFINW